MSEWSKWLPFPDPGNGGYLYAPFGPGIYVLRHRQSQQHVLFGQGGNVAFRMSSLLPKPYGQGSRDNEGKRKYVLDNIGDIEYRTLACKDVAEAKVAENNLRLNKKEYVFPT